MAAALDMGRLRGKQVVVYSHGGEAAEEHGVGLAVRMQLVHWSVAWRRGLRGVVWGWEPGCSRGRRVGMAVVGPPRRLVRSVPQCGCVGEL